MKGFNANQEFETRLENGDVIGAIEVAIAGADVAKQIAKDGLEAIEASQAKMARLAARADKYRKL